MAEDHPTAEPDEDEYGKVDRGGEPGSKAETHRQREESEDDRVSTGADAADISGAVPGDD